MEEITDPEPTGPYPPRYWWLKRVSAGVLLLTLVLVAAWHAWAREARGHLRAAVEPVRAAGDPVDAATLTASPVPEAENGARFYLEAARLALELKVDSPASSNMMYPDYPPYPPRWHRVADRSAEKNQPVFRLMREARVYRRFDWGVKIARPAHNTLWPHLNDARHLGILAGDAALHAHLNGDDAAALEYVRDVLHLADAVDAPPSFLLSNLVSVGIDQSMMYRLHLIAGALSVSADEGEATPAPLPLAKPTKRPATPAQVRALIAELAGGGEIAGGLRAAFAAERAVHLDMGDWVGDGVPLLKPMFDLDSVRMLRVNAARVRVAEQPDFQAARELLRTDLDLKSMPPPQTTLFGPANRPNPARWRKPVDYTRLLASDYCGSMMVGADRGIDHDARRRADRRLAAASLAVQLYRADHGGTLPPSLEALVPTYLPSLPADPYAAGGEPVRYVLVRGGLPGGGDRALVYSVGADGADDVADRGLPALPNEPLVTRGRGQADDLRDVGRFAPQAPQDPAGEAEAEREWAEEEARQRAREGTR